MVRDAAVHRPALHLIAQLAERHVMDTTYGPAPTEGVDARPSAPASRWIFAHDSHHDPADSPTSGSDRHGR